MASNIPVIVQGNSFSLAIPLQIYYINGDQMDLQDYTPDPTDEVSVQLKGSRRNYTYTPTIDGNVANIDLTGNELADNYGVVVSIVKANGQRLRSFRTDQFFIVESSDDLTPADIIEGLEENVIYLNAQPFIAGADGRGIESIVKTGTSGLVDTYTITYTDATTSTYNVTNGAQGEAGATIASVEKTATVGKVDTYTITMTDGATFDFEVTNGLDGVDLGLANIVNNLTTGGSTNVLSAEMGKELGDMLIERTESQLSGTTTESAKITNTGSVSTGNASYGSVTNIDVSSITSQVHIYGVCSGYNKSAYAFYDINNTLLLKGGSFTGETSVTVDDTITVPTGAKTLRLSQNRGTISMYATRFDESNKVDKLVADVNALQVTFTTTGRRLYGYDVIKSAKIDASGAIVTGTEAYGFITKIAIPNGVTKIRVYGNCKEYNKAVYAFYNGNTLVENGDSYSGVFNVDVDKVVDVPASANTLILSQNYNSYGSLFAEWAENTTQAEDVEVNLNDLTNFNSLTSAELMSLHSASQARAEGRMIFEDDFMGDRLNENIWGVDEGQFLNRNWYVNAKENVWVENSILHISATRTNRYGKVAAGQITTRGKFDFCGNIRIEGKFRMPTIQAFWPAFWTWGTDTYAYSQGTGDYAELDILELFGSSTNGKISCNLWTGVVETIGSDAGLTNEQGEIGKNDGNWHIYTADIYEDFVILSFDGVPFVKYTLATEQRQYIYTMRQYILISAQIQGNAQIPSTIDGATLECDWVHVYALGDDDIMPTAFSVPSTLSMSVGDKVRLIPTFTDGIMRTTTYDIVNENIVGHGDLVNSELVAKTAGTTDVFVITKNRKSAKCTITVS